MNRLLASLACAVALLGCGEQQSAKPVAAKTPAPVAGDVKAGKVFAETNCKACHGLDGGSVAPGVPHLAAQDERYLLGALKAYKEGKRSHAALKVIADRMSEAEILDAYPDLTADDIRAALKYAARAGRSAMSFSTIAAATRRPLAGSSQ